MDTKIELNNVTKNQHIVKKKESMFKKVADKINNFFSAKSKTNKETENLDSDTTKSNKNRQSFLKNKYIKTAIIVLIFGILALFILNSSFGSNLTSLEQSSSNNTYMSSFEYCEKLETKLVGLLSKIDGVGDVKVMVTIENGPELVIANNTDERTNTSSNGSTTTTTTTNIKEPILIKTSSTSTPLVVSEISPTITGVVVVASGAKDTKIRLNLLQAVQALLDVPNNNIQIYY